MKTRAAIVTRTKANGDAKRCPSFEFGTDVRVGVAEALDEVGDLEEVVEPDWVVDAVDVVMVVLELVTEDVEELLDDVLVLVSVEESDDVLVAVDEVSESVLVAGPPLKSNWGL